MKAIVLTLYPEMFPGTLGQSLAGKALEKSIWSLETIQIRDFATDKHKTVDDTPYGGGAGMVLRPDVIHAAIEHAKARLPNATLIYTSPRGTPFTQPMAEAFSKQNLIILCGRFEGVDQRVLDHHRMQEVSLGDFVLSGGEIAAQAMLDASVRLLDGVMGNACSMDQESFSQRPVEVGTAGGTAPYKNQQIFTEATEHFAGLLEYPQYTRPLVWNGVEVPEVLQSGNHQKIYEWRLEQSKLVTATRRPDLLRKKQ